MTIVLSFVVAINLIAFLAFRSDKSRAETERRRIPENVLLALAFCGGWFGAKLAQRKYRHKTNKQPFRLLLDLTPVAWLGVVFAVVALANIPDLEWNFMAERNDRATPKFFKSAIN